MVNYQDGKIYKIIFEGYPDIYVGSTTQPLYKRISVHRSHAKYEHYAARRKSKLNNFFREFGLACENHIVLLESYPCNTKEELFARERHWIEELNPTLNQQIPSRSYEEYCQTEHYKQLKQKWDATYRARHLDRIQEYDRQRRRSEEYKAKKREKYRENEREKRQNEEYKAKRRERYRLKKEERNAT